MLNYANAHSDLSLERIMVCRVACTVPCWAKKRPEGHTGFVPLVCTCSGV